MDQSASTSDPQRLEAAIRRLEAALAGRPAAAGDADLRRRHETLIAESQAALDGIDRVLSGAGG